MFDRCKDIDKNGDNFDDDKNAYSRQDMSAVTFMAVGSFLWGLGMLGIFLKTDFSNIKFSFVLCFYFIATSGKDFLRQLVIQSSCFFKEIL